MSKINLYYARNPLQWLLSKDLNVVVNNESVFKIRANTIVTKDIDPGQAQIQMSAPYFGSEIGKSVSSFVIQEDDELFITYKPPFLVFSAGTIFVEKGNKPNLDIINRNEIFKTILKFIGFGLIAWFVLSLVFLIFASSLGGISSKPNNDKQIDVHQESTNVIPNSSNNNSENETQSTLTVSQENAVKKATGYLNYMAFSKLGLINQLEYEGFSNEDAVIAIESLDVDWTEQAYNKANSYLKIMAYSRSGLISQLEYEGFSNEEAVNGIDALKIDWFEQASLKAKAYLKIMAYSRSGLISQLEYEGFSKEEATYGVDTTGL